MLKPHEMLSKAITLASTKHEGQFDKGGAPYILHPLKVMHYLKTNDHELMAIAVMHDVVEDTDVTFADLVAHGFSVRVVDGVRSLTKMTGETYDEYKARVKANIDAVHVKMADLRHNSDIRRLKGVTAKDIARIEKYMKFHEELKALI